MKTNPLRSIDLWWMRSGGGEYQQNPFWDPRRSLYDYFWSCQIFIFSLETRNYLLSSILIKIDQIWEMGFDWQWISYSGVGLTSGQNSVMSKFGGGGAEGLKLQTMFFFLANR